MDTTTLPYGNTPMDQRETVVLSTGFTHKGFPVAVEQHLVRSEGCHRWAGFLSKQGEPVITYGGFKFNARDWIYEYVYDLPALPKGTKAVNTCTGVLCVNPEHLALDNPA